MARQPTTSARPYPHKEPPRLTLSYVAMAWNIALIVIVVIATMLGGSPAFWVISAILLNALMLVGNYRTHMRLVAKRQKIRDENEMSWWTHREMPRLSEPTDWQEIEQAMEMLLRDGIEPTYERAKDRLKTIESGYCQHPDMRRINDATWKCWDCHIEVPHGQLAPPRPNPFRRRTSEWADRFFKASDVISNPGSPVCDRCGGHHTGLCPEESPFAHPVMED